MTCRAARCLMLAAAAAMLASCGAGGSARRDGGHPVVIEHRFPEGLADLRTGDYFTPAIEHEPIPIDPRFRHVLTFQMTPMAPPSIVPLRSNGPLVLVSDANEAIVFSPLDHFFETLVWLGDDGAIHSGIEGEIDALPPGFTHRFLFVEGRGVNATMTRWGDLLRAEWKRERPDRYADRGLASLGYWTDNGAIYYYATAPDQTEQDTLLAVKRDADARGIPYGYVQLDSWWYFKEARRNGVLGGLVRWEPQPWMFPDGLAAFQAELGLPLVLHNRWFAVANDYRDDYAFVEGDGEPAMALPLERGVYDRFMADARAWGAVTYEQDWLMAQFWGVRWLREEVGRAEQWMQRLDDAARAEGLTMQLTMPGPAHLMDSVRRASVTSARVSIDYLAGAPKAWWWPEYYETSLLAWAVGVWPFKDTFQSASGQRKLFSERRPEAEALVSALSAAMVGPSDAIGAADRGLLMRTCRADGRLLKPDRPATPIDAMFRPHARPFWVSTESRRAGIGTWTYLAGFHLARGGDGRRALDALGSLIEYDVPIDTMFHYPEIVSDWSVDLAEDLGIRTPVIVYDWRTGAARVVSRSFSIDPLAEIEDHAYLVLAPILSNGLALVGEPAKFVTMADERFTDVALEADAIRVTLAGTPGERIEILAYDARASRFLSPEPAVMGPDGSAAARLGR